jgi:hypothetical protein
MRQVLLMTATIAPKAGTYMLARSDAETRLADYVQSLRLYTSHLKSGVLDMIIFAENSGAPLDVLRAVVAQEGVADKVHFISFTSDDDPNRSRFILELNLIKTALSQASLSGLISADDRLWKVTGRYLIGNLAAIIRTAPVDAALYVNSRRRPKPWTDFFLAGFNQAAFAKTFLPHLEDYDNFTPGEQVLYERINGPNPPPIKVVQRMRRTPRLAGVRGFDGRRYDDMRGRVGYALRVAARVLAPWVWI